MKIIVNGKEYVTDLKEMSYENLVVQLGYNSSRILSVMYSYPKEIDRRDGSLIPGKSIPLAERMIFDVADTSNA